MAGFNDNNGRPPIILIGEDNLPLASLRQHLAKENAYALIGSVKNFPDAFQFLRIRKGSVLAVIDVSREPEKAFRMAHEMKLKFPNVHLLMTASDTTPETILTAMRSGAEEFIPQPFNWPEVSQALERMRKKISDHRGEGERQGQVIVVFSPKGGTGVTTVATHLAVMLARKPLSVSLVDLALQFGSVTAALNLEPSYTILEMVKNLKQIDPFFLDGALVKHPSGVRVLAEPFLPEAAQSIEPHDVEQVLDILVQSFDFVVVDTPKSFDDTLRLVLDRADLILFVTDAGLPSLRNAQKALALFQRMKLRQEKVRLVLNRYTKNKVVSLESLEKILDMKVFWTIPDEYAKVAAALNQGLSLYESDSQSTIAKSFRDLTEAVISLSAPDDHKPKRRPGILSRWMPIFSRDER